MHAAGARGAEARREGRNWDKMEVDTRLNWRRTLGGERAAEALPQNGRKSEVHTRMNVRCTLVLGPNGTPLRGGKGAQQGSGHTPKPQKHSAVVSLQLSRAKAPPSRESLVRGSLAFLPEDDQRVSLKGAGKLKR